MASTASFKQLCPSCEAPVTIRDAADKQRLHDELRTKLADLSVVADTVVGAALSTAGKAGFSMEQRIDTQLDRGIQQEDSG